MVSEQTKCLDHGGEDSTLIILWKDWKKKKKKTSLCVRGSVGSPTSAKHGLIKVNIYGGIFLPLQGLLVGDKRGSEILTATINPLQLEALQGRRLLPQIFEFFEQEGNQVISTQIYLLGNHL